MKTIITSLVVLLTASNAFAHGDEKKMFVCSNVDKAEFTKQMEKHHEKFLKKLKFTKDQEKQVKAIQAQHADSIFAHVQKIRGAHTELMGTVEKDGTKESIRASFQALEKEKQALMDEKIDMMLAIRDVATPEQRQKAVAEMKDKMKDLCD
jgi:Spy/CpxP family protein refolding chaperone